MVKSVEDMRQFLISEQKRMIVELSNLPPGHNIMIDERGMTLMEMFEENLANLESGDEAIQRLREL